MNNKEPTYINNKNGADSLLDLTFLSLNLAIKARTAVLKTNFDSDHFPVLIKIDGKLEENIVYESRWNLKKKNWEKFKQESENLVNIDKCDTEDIDEFFDNICSQIYKCADSTIPKTNPRPPKTHTLLYWNETIKTAVKAKKPSLPRMEENKYNRRSCGIQKTEGSSPKNNPRRSKTIMAAFLRRSQC